MIQPDELAGHLDTVSIFDLRWSLADPAHGKPAYLAGHLPGAVYVDLSADLCATPGPGRHPLPDPGVFTLTLGRLGVSPDSKVVVYDDAAGTVAARLWWMLRAIGHHAVRLLDGGYQAWVQAGLPVETDDIEAIPAVYPPAPGFDGVVTYADLDGRILLDARAAERYRGEVEPVDPKPGHIPGALSYPLFESLGADGKFKSPSMLAERFGGLPDTVPVVYCGSGVNACHLAVALVISGRGMPDLYAGSYSDWTGRDLPVDTGGPT